MRQTANQLYMHMNMHMHRAQHTTLSAHIYPLQSRSPGPLFTFALESESLLVMS